MTGQLEATETQREQRTVVYLGRRINGGKVVYSAQVGDEERLYSKRPFAIPAYASPGQKWAITFDVGTDTYYIKGPDAPKYVGQFPDAEYRARWEAEDRAAYAFSEQTKEARADGGGIADLCRPLAQVYASSTPMARSALLVRIIAEVQKGAR